MYYKELSDNQDSAISEQVFITQFKSRMPLQTLQFNCVQGANGSPVSVFGIIRLPLRLWSVRELFHNWLFRCFWRRIFCNNCRNLKLIQGHLFRCYKSVRTKLRAVLLWRRWMRRSIIFQTFVYRRFTMKKNVPKYWMISTSLSGLVWRLQSCSTQSSPRDNWRLSPFSLCSALIPALP